MNTREKEYHMKDKKMERLLLAADCKKLIKKSVGFKKLSRLFY